VKCMMDFMGNRSKLDAGWGFASCPAIECDDWRQAQIAMERDNFQCSITGKVKFEQEGNRLRTVFILPSTAVMRESAEYENPQAYIKGVQKDFLGVFKRGLRFLGEDSAVSSKGLDGVLDILDSCCVLWELDEPEDEIKYQCSCYTFWHYCKCHHSLAYSIKKKGVSIPPIYDITNIGSTRKRGRPTKPKGGEALGSKR